MDKLAKTLSETPGLIKSARRSFMQLADNQAALAKILRSSGDPGNLRMVQRNMRLLAAINAGMQRFILLSKEEEEVKPTQASSTVNTSQLQKDVIESEEGVAEAEG